MSVERPIWPSKRRRAAHTNRMTHWRTFKQTQSQFYYHPYKYQIAAIESSPQPIAKSIRELAHQQLTERYCSRNWRASINQSRSTGIDSIRYRLRHRAAIFPHTPSRYKSTLHRQSWHQGRERVNCKRDRSIKGEHREIVLRELSHRIDKAHI